MAKPIVLTLLFFNLLFSYSLAVKTQKDAKILEQKYNLSCKQNKDGFYICATSPDINQLLQLKDYFKKENIKAYILNSETKTPQKTSTLSVPKTGYCIQVASSKNKKAIEKLFNKYKNYPLARVEKIGNFYVIRIGEGRLNEIKRLYSDSKTGFIRKCDIIPQRIVLSNLNFTAQTTQNNIVNFNSDFSNSNLIPKKPQQPDTVIMYKKLNSGDLAGAERIAKKLLHTKNAPKAYEVLGIIAMKKNRWKEACDYLRKSNNRKLFKTACYTYNLKQGYKYLNIDPKKALYYFNNAEKYKTDDNITLGKAYAYLNLNEYNKAVSLFKKLYQKNPNSDKILQGYILALYKTKNYSEIEKLRQENPDKKYLFLSYETYINLKKANELIKQKKYAQAEKILINLYKNNPQDINIMLALGNLYLQTGELNKAEDFYKNVLIISPENIYALEGLKAVALKRKNYKQALMFAQKAQKLGLSQNDTDAIKFLYYYNLASESLNKKECKKVLNYINELKKLKPHNPNVYILFGDYYKTCKNDKREALINYSKAYQLSKDNFDITLKFLYSLLNYNMFEQIKLLLPTIKTDKLTPEQKEKLKKFYADLYLKYASKLYNDKNYKEAIKAADYGLTYDPLNKDFYVIKGWSCFRIKNYKCARDSFENALKLDPNDEKITYDLALSEIQLGNKKRAEELLDSIADTKNEDLKLKIANAYLAIGDIQKAQKLLNTVKTPPKKEIIINPKQNNEFFPDVLKQQSKVQIIEKESFTPNQQEINREVEILKKKIELQKSRYLSFLEGGLSSKLKSGQKGLDKLNSNLFYLKGRYFFNPHNSIYAKLGFILLSSGGKPDFTKVGSPNPSTFYDDWITSSKGYLIKYGFEHTGNLSFKIELGSTPMGTKSKISSTFTGLGEISYKKNSQKFGLKIQKNAVTDSILSYIGNNDPYSDRRWGRVTETSVKLSYQKTLDKNDSMVYLSFLSGSLDGYDTHKNSRITLEVLPLLYMGNNISDSDYAGLYFNLTNYSKNENKFLYGYGGYFSPKNFILIAPRYEGYILKYNYGIKFYVMGGILTFEEDSTKTGFSFEGGAVGKYRLDNNLFIKGGLALRKSPDYSETFLNISCEYYFGHKYRIYKTELNKNLKEMLRQW